MKDELKYGTTETTNKLLGGEYFDTGTGDQLKPFSAISSDSLRDESPVDVVDPRPSVESAGFQGYLETQAKSNQDAYTRNLETKAEQAKSSADKSLENYIFGLENQEGEITKTDRLYSREGGVDDIESELNKINQDILAEQVGLQRQIEKIRENRGGLYGTAVEDEVDRVTRDSLRKQADMSIIQMGVQGRYDSAKTIADRAVAVALEKDKNRNEALKLTYERNQDLFDESEKRAFESAQADRENELEMKKITMERNYDLAIEAMKDGAPGDVVKSIMGAGNTEDAMKFYGDYQSGGTSGTFQLAQAQDNINQIQGIVSVENLAGAVGPNAIARVNLRDPFTGEKSNFIAGVEQLRSQLTLDSLIQAKAKGATFGALSEGELRTLSASASKLGTWAVKDGDGNIKGYKANKKDFKAELDRIGNFAKLDYVLKGGNPEDVGVTQMPDGSLFTENSDGTITQLR